MDQTKDPSEIQDGVVVTMSYELMVDGEKIDSSEEGRPITFIQGQGNIISGLEDQLYGMLAGDTKEVLIAAERGYGEVDPEDIVDIPRKEFPPEIPLEPGVELELKDRDGDPFSAHIVSVGAESVRLDFNHPLAGKDLRFSVKVVALRNATTDELDHGHAH